MGDSQQTEPAVMWRFDPDTFDLIEPNPGRRYTATEWAAQRFPGCPLCGTTVRVVALDVTLSTDPERMYTGGVISCPSGCDPFADRRTP